MASNNSSSQSADYSMVVAIDFGTCYSGYAYSNRKRSKTEKVEISHSSYWNIIGIETFKTPTCILFTNNKSCVYFGYDAQNELSRLQREKTESDYYYFENFKMHLYELKESINNFMLPDMQGKLMPAKTVFAKSINVLKEDALNELKRKRTGNPVTVSEIRWVLTVPAIWKDDSKFFMRECASEAGIPQENLLIALEPEAASIYCQCIRNIRGLSSEGFIEMPAGTKYCVVDVGGGTTDITIHEKTSDGALKELRCPVGNNVGGLEIDKTLMKWLERILKTDLNLLEELKTLQPNSYIDILRQFENAKKSASKKEIKTVDVPLPRYDLEKILHNHFKETYSLVDHIHTSRSDLNLHSEKLSIPTKEIQKEMQPIIDKIIENIRKAFTGNVENELKIIILVGGFAESEVFQSEVENEFHQIKVIVPKYASLAVLKGAVLFGHHPDFINPRITRFTYGVEVTKAFDETIHYNREKDIDDWGHYYCRGCFDRLIGINESVPLRTFIRRRYRANKKFLKLLVAKVYSTEQEKPLYVDDKCKKIGQIEIPLSNPDDTRREIEIEFTFWDTEIKIKATDVKYGQHINSTIELR